jgi:hypothetical protein
MKAMKQYLTISRLVALATFFGFLSSSAVTHAQFDSLIKKLQEVGQQQQGTGQQQQGAGAFPLAPPDPVGKKKNKSGLMSDGDWCSNHSGALGNMKPDTSLIAKEFVIKNLESLQDEFDNALKNSRISKTFPNASFFQRNFETVKVRSIYDTFIAFPEPDTLAALIQLSGSNDQQERGDALMALVFLHLQAPNLSVTPTRWKELADKAYAYPHYTALVFRGRVNAYGEYAPQNVNAAVGYLFEAASLPDKYRQPDGIRMEFDIENYQTVKSATFKDIMASGYKFSGGKLIEGLAKTSDQIEAAQKAYADRFPSTRLGKLYKEVELINRQAMDKGTQMISLSQGGNQAVGQIESMKSLKGTQEGDKKTFVYINPVLQKAQLRFFQQSDGGVSPEQKKLLVEAQEKRYVAQGLLSNAFNELTAEMLRGFGDLIKMTASLEAIKQANAATIQSCMITSKWEQAMRAKDVPAADKKKAAATVATDLSKYKDD